jgi:selenocysteine-specific elongation factor
MSCIGTAGHVDHGKSALVKVLTGIDPDRLQEEKERGMTIDLGFAWLQLPSGQEISIVDVPGHEDFIKNMLAGVGGIDAALLVIAADEGIMPQTREHLAILDLLHVSQGVVALTKSDLVDEEWLALVREEVADYLRPTSLHSAEIISVSAFTSRGIPQLIAALERVVATLMVSPSRQNIARPHLPIDRVFSLTGFGTVVTGTLLDGSLKLAQEVEIVPQGSRTRIRGMQSHKQQIDYAQPGNRVALNLANVPRTAVARGDVVALPGQLHATNLLDVRFELLADVSRPLEHNTEVEFYCGSQEISARARLLDMQELAPGKSGWVQLRLDKPAVVARRDRFILRIPSPSTTIGGGEVIDVKPRYHRRFQPQVLENLERLMHSTPDELVIATLNRGISVNSSVKKAISLQGWTLEEVTKQCNLAQDVTLQILETLLSAERVCKLGPYWFSATIWERAVDEAIRIVREYHQQYPLRAGISKEEWRAHLGLPTKMTNEMFVRLREEGRLQEVDALALAMTGGAARTHGLICLPDFSPMFTLEQQEKIEQLFKQFVNDWFTPPGRAEIEHRVGTEVLNALVEQGRLMKISEDIFFLPEAYEQAKQKLVGYMREHERMTVAEARDVVGTTRKYILPLLEHLDALRLTRRLGDERMLAQLS